MTPKKVVDRLEIVLGAAAKPQRLLTVIEAELQSHFGLGPLAALERAEAIAESVSKLIAERAAAALGEERLPCLVVIGSTNDTVVGYFHVLPGDALHIAAAKQNRAQQQALLTAMRGLHFSEFETFGKRVLHELGAGYAHVTPHGNDQGIDFFGHFSLGQLQELPAPFFKLAHDVRLLFAGQGKHYPTRTLGPDVVRELVGAVSLARTKTFSKDGVDLFADLDIRPFSPVVALLFTTGAVTKGAYKLGASAGVVVKSGEQLATFLADRGVGMDSSSGVAAFDEALFRDWLSATSVA